MQSASASRRATPPSSRTPTRSTTAPARSGRCSSGRTTASPAPPATPRSAPCSATAGSAASFPTDLKPARPAHLADFYALDDRSMLDREPPAHTRLRGLVLRAFTSRRIAGLGPDIAALATTLIDALRRRRSSTCSPPSPSRCRSWSSPGCSACPRPCRRRAARLVARHGRHVPGAPRPRRRGRRQRRRTRLRRFPPRPCRRAARAGPADDLITELIAAEAAGDRLDTEELIATCVLLLNAGHEATVHAIGNGVAAILAAGLDPAALFATREPPRRPWRRCCASTRRCTSSPATPSRTSRSSATASAAATPSAACSPPPTATRRASPTRAASTRPARPARSSPSAPASISASARRSRALELAIALPMLFARLPGLALAAPPGFADRYHFRGLEPNSGSAREGR